MLRGLVTPGRILLEIADADDDLAAHRHRVPVLDAGGDALHPRHVAGDALAPLAVAAGDGVDHLAVAVDDLDRDPVELLGDEEVARDRADLILGEELVAAGEPGAELVLGDGLVERPHRDLVAGLVPLAHELGGADLGEDGVGGIERAQLVFRRRRRRRPRSPACPCSRRRGGARRARRDSSIRALVEGSTSSPPK